MATEELYRKLSASELSAIILKGSNDRDTGFCSGGSEVGDDLSVDHSRLEPRSPTDASEDSVEVKVTPISYTRNKRKSTEPSRVICEQETGPLKKRIRYTSTTSETRKSETTVIETATNHFRPWDQSDLTSFSHEDMPNPAEVLIRHPGVTTLHRALLDDDDDDDVQQEPLALIAKKPTTSNITENSMNGSTDHLKVTTRISSQISCSSNDNEIIPLTVNCSNKTDSNFNSVPLVNNNDIGSSGSSSTITSTITSNKNNDNNNQRPQQRNYKNMTRERRIEANARERTRVHTISAAYDTLRRAIPSYSHTQKLSKLSVLRIACSYILTLSRMAGEDYSEDQSAPSIAQCIDLVTKTIQTEGKIRKKKDE